MAEQNLLFMVQNILSSMSSDEVNSISDTTESMQVAQIIENKYYDIAARGSLAEHTQLFQFDPSNDTTKPTLMFVKPGVAKIEWVKYFDTNPLDSTSLQTSQFGSYHHGLNVDVKATSGKWTATSTTSNTIGTGTKTFTVASGLNITAQDGVTASSGPNQLIGLVTSYSGTTLVINVLQTIGSGTYTAWSIINSGIGTAAPGYLYVTVIGLSQFIDMTNRYDPTQTNVGSFTLSDTSNSFPGNFTFYYRSDKQPQWCTVLSNTYVIFDSYDFTQETTLQSNKTMCYGQVVPVFNLTDTFIPDLDDQQFPLLLNEAKALAFYELKQQPHAKAEQEIKRQWAVVQKTKSIDNKPSYFDQLPNFGRRIGTGGYAIGPTYGYSYRHQQPN